MQRGKCTRPYCDYWHPPECQFYKSDSGCEFGEKCSCAHRQVEDQPQQKRCTTVGVCISGHNLTSATHKSSAASCKHPRKQRSVARKNQVKVPHQRSPYAPKFEDRSHEETERQEQCASVDAWRLAKNILELQEKEKHTFSQLPTNGVPRAIRNETRGEGVLLWTPEHQCTG